MKQIADELVKICRFFGVFEKEAVCCGAVTVPQCLILQKLLDSSNDISSLAQSSGVSISTMTRLVDGLQRRGWVERRRDDDDRRRVLVRLTEAGKHEAEQLRESTESAVSAVLKRIPAEKLDRVLESVTLVRKAMEELRTYCGPSCGPP